MTMKSLDLIPNLGELPGQMEGDKWSNRDHLTALLEADQTLRAAEYSVAASTGMWALFDNVNVDDTLRENLLEAYQAQYPGLDASHPLTEQWAEMIDRGPESMEGFMNGLKGKIAEFDARDQLQEAGWSDVEVAQDPTQAVWDIRAVSPEGTLEYWQVKNVGAEQAGNIQQLMTENPDVNFALNSEVYGRVAESAPELVERMMDTGPMVDIEGMGDGLTTLSDNLGIDIPDGIGEIIPYAAAIVGAARLIHSVIQTERTFKEADRTTINKIHVVQTLTLMSRMGITTLLAAAGGAGGTALGSAIPGVGNLIGGIGGTLTGAGVGMYLNRHLQPHMLSLALDIVGMEEDDLFYFKNKPRIDEIAISMRGTTVPTWSN